MRGARGCFGQNGGEEKKNTVENHLQFGHIQLADNRERWRAIHLSRHQMLPVNLF